MLLSGLEISSDLLWFKAVVAQDFRYDRVVNRTIKKKSKLEKNYGEQSLISLRKMFFFFKLPFMIAIITFRERHFNPKR